MRIATCLSKRKRLRRLVGVLSLFNIGINEYDTELVHGQLRHFIIRNQKRMFLRKSVNKIQISCQMGLLGKPFVLALVHLQGGNA